MSPGYQVVQSAHAIADFSIKHKEIFKSWQQGSNYLCCLSTDSKSSLEKFIQKLEQLGIKHSVFYEPDIDEITAVCSEPLNKKEHTRIFSKFKLTLS